MFELLSKTINKKRFNWSKEKIIDNQRIFSEWEKSIISEYGHQVVTLAKPYLFKNQRLTIVVRNSTIACEIQAKKEKIRININKVIGKDKIKEIILRVN